MHAGLHDWSTGKFSNSIFLVHFWVGRGKQKKCTLYAFENAEWSLSNYMLVICDLLVICDYHAYVGPTHSYTPLFVRLPVFNNKIKDMKLLASNSVGLIKVVNSFDIIQEFKCSKDLLTIPSTFSPLQLLRLYDHEILSIHQTIYLGLYKLLWCQLLCDSSSKVQSYELVLDVNVCTS